MPDAPMQETLRQAEDLQRQGRPDEARRLLRQALEQDPTPAELHKALGDTCLGMGRPDEAEAAYRQAIAARPDYFQAQANLGNLLLSSERPEAAAACYEEAIRIAPEIAELHDNLGNALRLAGAPDRARRAHERALELKPGLATAHANLGLALGAQGEHLAAREQLETALRMEPGLTEAAVALTALHRRLGDYPEAEAVIAPFAAGHQQDIRIALQCADLHASADRPAEALQMLAPWRRRPGIPAALKRRLEFQLGDIYDQTGDYLQAFEHYRAAHGLRRPDFDRAGLLKMVAEIEAVFSGSPPTAPPGLPGHRRLVFVVGLPRAGKSLLEQMLAAHPQVAATGEADFLGSALSSIREITGARPPGAIRRLGPSDLERLAREALAELGRPSPPAARVLAATVPTGWRHLGLLAMLFPRATFVHMRRDPRDTCLECYFKEFLEPHPHTETLADLGLHYRQTRRMMDFWERARGIPLYPVDYEALVTGPEETLRGLLDHLGLPWDPACLDFHTSARTVAGERATRTPLSPRHLGRWRHYRPWIGELLRALEAGGAA